MARTALRRTRTVLLAALCAGAAVVSVPTAAMAATPESACGSVYLMWNNSTQQNCVATIKTSYAGTPTTTQAALGIQGSPDDTW